MERMTFYSVIHLMTELGSVPELRNESTQEQILNIASLLDGETVSMDYHFTHHGKYGVAYEILPDGRVKYTLDDRTRIVKASSYFDLVIRWTREYIESYWRGMIPVYKSDRMLSHVDTMESYRDTFVTVWGHAKGIIAADELTHEIVSGRDIYETYYDDGWGYPSCMSKNPEASMLYVKNPDKFSMVRFKRNEEPYGRVMLIHADDGNTYTSTVYSDNINYITLRLEQLSREHGWKSLADVSYPDVDEDEPITVTCKQVRSGEVPYIDSGRYNWFSVDTPIGNGTFTLYYGLPKMYKGDMDKPYTYSYRNYNTGKGSAVANGTPDRAYHYYPQGYWSGVYRLDSHSIVNTAEGQQSEYDDYILAHPEMFIMLRGEYYLREDLSECPMCCETVLHLRTLINGEHGCKECTRPVNYYIPGHSSWNGHSYSAPAERSLGYWYIDSDEPPPLVSVWALNRYGEKYRYDTLPEYVWRVSHDVDGEGGIELWLKDCIPQGVTVWGQGVLDLSTTTE